MIGGIVEIAEDGRYLSIFRGFLKISVGDQELGRVPLDDIAALVLSAAQVSLSKTVITALLERKAVIVTTGRNWHPLGLTLSLDGHYGQAGILQDQINLSIPRQKRLWQHIVQAKISNQKNILERVQADPQVITELGILLKRVRSGDPDNREAQAARHYWPALLGSSFRRERRLEDANSFLNYGYAILRAATARAVVAAGLTPALGLHHRSQVNSFALVDDLMEPFRPLVDWKVAKMHTKEATLTPETKQVLVGILQMDLLSDKGSTPLINGLQQLAVSLVSCLRHKDASLALPQLYAAGSLFLH